MMSPWTNTVDNKQVAGGYVSDRATLCPETWVDGKSVVCEEVAATGPTVRIEGRSLVGPGCRLISASQFRDKRRAHKTSFAGAVTVSNSVLTRDCSLEPGVTVEESRLGADVSVGLGASLHHSRADDLACVLSQAVVQESTLQRGAVVGEFSLVANSVVGAGCVIGRGIHVRQSELAEDLDLTVSVVRAVVCRGVRLAISPAPYTKWLRSPPAVSVGVGYVSLLNADRVHYSPLYTEDTKGFTVDRLRRAQESDREDLDAIAREVCKLCFNSPESGAIVRAMLFVAQEARLGPQPICVGIEPVSIQNGESTPSLTS